MVVENTKAAKATTASAITPSAIEKMTCAVSTSEEASKKTSQRGNPRADAPPPV
jgi:hypothetical protein